MSYSRPQALCLSAPLLCALLAAPASAEQDNSVRGVGKSREDIDYSTLTVGIGGSAVTTVGKFDCTIARTKGRTRIDSFNNIFGVDSVLNSEWKDYAANRLGCLYGIRFDAAGGTVTAGVGYDDYRGKTADEPGGKTVEVRGGGLNLDYVAGERRVSLNWRQKAFDILHRNEASYGSYDSLIRLDTQSLLLQAALRTVFIEVEHVRGDKENAYSTPLFPTNTFAYVHTQIAVGPLVSVSDHASVHIAPLLTQGSYRGSFMPLETETALNGLIVGFSRREVEIGFRASRFDGQGERPYLPVTDRIAETKAYARFELDIALPRWEFGIINSRYRHTGNVTVGPPIYVAILGRPGPFENLRRENKWSARIQHSVDARLSLALNMYYTRREDRQYDFPEHRYSERGGGLVADYAF